MLKISEEMANGEYSALKILFGLGQGGEEQ